MQSEINNMTSSHTKMTMEIIKTNSQMVSKRPYRKVTKDLRWKLLETMRKNNNNIKQSAKLCGINYSTAKNIASKFYKERKIGTGSNPNISRFPIFTWKHFADDEKQFSLEEIKAIVEDMPKRSYEIDKRVHDNVPIKFDFEVYNIMIYKE